MIGAIHHCEKWKGNTEVCDRECRTCGLRDIGAPPARFERIRERTRARRRRNLQRPPGSLQINIGALSPCFRPSRKPAINQITRARGDLEFLGRHRKPLDINTPGSDNAGWRVIGTVREEIYDLRASCASCVDVLERGLRGFSPWLFARSRIIVAFDPIAPRNSSDAIRKCTVKYKNGEYEKCDIK